MPANLYRFVEEWWIPAPMEAVWEVLAAAELLPRWWRGVYQEIEPLGPYAGPAVGNRYRARARGFLPYQLRFVLETAVLERPRVVGVQVEGDLTGTWTATLLPRDGGTHVGIEQVVTADKPLLRWFSPLLKPLFAWNHRWTTPRGEAGLRAYLAEQAGRAAVPRATTS
jgi:hypothetical protein